MKLVKVEKYYDSLFVCVDATVAQAEKTFAISVLQSADNKMYTNICDPAVPVKPPIITVRGLNNYPTPGHLYPLQPPGPVPLCGLARGVIIKRLRSSHVTIRVLSQGRSSRPSPLLLRPLLVGLPPA